MQRFLACFVASLSLVIGDAVLADDVVPLTRIRLIETDLPYDVEVLATSESLANDPDLDLEVVRSNVDELVLFFPNNEVLVRPLPPANGNNVLVEYAPLQFLFPFTNFGAATPYNTGGGPSNVNSFSFTTQTSPILPRLLGTSGYLSFKVNPDCPNCK
jgi:hypothetical protein